MGVEGEPGQAHLVLVDVAVALVVVVLLGLRIALLLAVGAELVCGSMWMAILRSSAVASHTLIKC